jgi:hypothetical protein
MQTAPRPSQRSLSEDARLAEAQKILRRYAATDLAADDPELAGRDARAAAGTTGCAPQAGKGGPP